MVQSSLGLVFKGVIDKTNYTKLRAYFELDPTSVRPCQDLSQDS